MQTNKYLGGPYQTNSSVMSCPCLHWTLYQISVICWAFIYLLSKTGTRGAGEKPQKQLSFQQSSKSYKCVALPPKDFPFDFHPADEEDIVPHAVGDGAVDLKNTYVAIVSGVSPNSCGCCHSDPLRALNMLRMLTTFSPINPTFLWISVELCLLVCLLDKATIHGNTNTCLDVL